MKKTKQNNTKSHTHVVVYLTLLTGPLRIQLWSQDRGSYTKTNRERTRSEKNKKQTNRGESIRQKEAGVKVACKGHNRQEGIQEGENQETKAK